MEHPFKLAIYVWNEVRAGQDQTFASSVQIFGFNTKAAAKAAATHFERGDTFVLLIEDKLRTIGD